MDWEKAFRLAREHIGSPIQNCYNIEFVTAETYWAYAEERFHEDVREFQDDLYLLGPQLLSPVKTAQIEDLRRARGGERLQMAFLLKESEHPIGGFFGFQEEIDTWHMYSSHIRITHRRRGLYSEGLKRVVAWAASVGFAKVTSRHAIHNTPVILAKLKANFHITGIAIDLEAGPCLDLARFLALEQENAYRYRLGLNIFTPQMVKASMGTANTLCEILQTACLSQAGSEAGESSIH